MSIYWLPLFVLLGAGLNRHRGGWIPTHHTQWARADYSVGFALLLFWSTQDWRVGLAAVPAFFLGSLVGNANWFWVLTVRDFFQGTRSGIINVSLVCAVIAGFHPWFGWWPLALAGATKGAAYLAGRTLWPITKIDQFHNGPEAGEVLFGAAMGAGVFFVGMV